MDIVYTRMNLGDVYYEAKQFKKAKREYKLAHEGWLYQYPKKDHPKQSPDHPKKGPDHHKKKPGSS